MNNPPPDEAAHQDGQLMHELTVVNAQISRYVLRFWMLTLDGPSLSASLTNGHLVID